MDSILIIGAGATGLSAARTLSKAGKTVIVLEARDRIGGRIFTTQEKPFSVLTENGAEFIHGDLAYTKALAKEAGVELRKGEGRSYQLLAGKTSEGDPFDEGWGEFIKALKRLEEDINVAEFLQLHFSEPRYDSLRDAVLHFVQGFDAADATKASAFALREEWTNSDDESLTGYHLEGGYVTLMNFLQQECLKQSVVFHLSAPVQKIRWRKGHVTVTTDKGTFTANAVLITIPPAVLKNETVTFIPELPVQDHALQKIETGGVIKFLIEFTEPVWENNNPAFRQFSDLHFLFSDAYVPTWWTQRPSIAPLLTGWLSGPDSWNVSNATDEELLSGALKSLAYIFDCSPEQLKSVIRATKVINWNRDPWSLGAYVYKTVGMPQTIQYFSYDIEQTLYFAGEAYYDGPEMGTVEAALASGEERANKMLNLL